MESILRDGVDFQNLSGNSFASDAHFFDDATSPSQVQQQLSSNKESDKLHGMKWLLAGLSKGKEITEFFPDVVKNVVAKSVEVKKLVYTYLVHYADANDATREMALMSINSFQQDMSGSNQLIRGMALRVMTSIRVPDIIQLQLLATRKCAADESPYVRKCAATALGKIHAMDADQLPQLVAILEILVKDATPMVLGSALTVFNVICPGSFEILQPHYKKICHLLADMDEWTQVSVLQVLTQYIRHHFMNPDAKAKGKLKTNSHQQSQHHSKAVATARNHMLSPVTPSNRSGSSVKNSKKKKTVVKGFYSDDEEDNVESEEEEFEDTQDSYDNSPYHLSKPTSSVSPTNKVSNQKVTLANEHALVLKSSLPLFKSRNSSVVCAVCTFHYYCNFFDASLEADIVPTASNAPYTFHVNPLSNPGALENCPIKVATADIIGKAMIRILRNKREIQFVVLTNILSMMQKHPFIFAAYMTDFFIKEADPIFNRRLKLDILTAVCSEDNVVMLLRELQVYVKHTNTAFSCAAIEAIGRLALRFSDISDSVMLGLLDIVMLHCQSQQLPDQCGTSAFVIRQLFAAIPKAVYAPTASRSSTSANGTFSGVKLKVLRSLAKVLVIARAEGGLVEPTARANAIWILSEFCKYVRDEIGDILRCLVNDILSEETDTKMQILNLAIKVTVLLPEESELRQVAVYALELARYDVDVDVRDRSRFMTVLLGMSPSASESDSDKKSADSGLSAVQFNESALVDIANSAKEILLDGRRTVHASPVAVASMVSSDKAKRLNELKEYRLGTMSGVLHHRVAGYVEIKDWAVRDVVTVAQSADTDKGYGGDVLASPWKDTDGDVVGKRSDRNGYESTFSYTSSSSGYSSSDSDTSDSDDTSSSGYSSSDSDTSSAPSDDNLLSPMGRPMITTLSNHALLPCTKPGAPSLDIFENNTMVLPTSAATPTPTLSDPYSNQANSGGSLLSLHEGDMLSPVMPMSTISTPWLATTATASESQSTPSSTDPSFLHSLLDLPSLPPQPLTDAMIMSQVLESFPVQPPVNSTTASTTNPTGANVAVNPPNSGPSHAEITENMSDPRSILKPEKGNGLSIRLVFCRGTAPSRLASHGACTACFIVHNQGNHAWRSVRISLSKDIRHTAIGDVNNIQPKQELKLPFEIEVLESYIGKPMRVDVRSDAFSSAVACSFTPEIRDVLSPLRWSLGEFSTARSMLASVRGAAVGGFTEVIRSFPKSLWEKFVDSIPVDVTSPHTLTGKQMDLRMLITRVALLLMNGHVVGEQLLEHQSRTANQASDAKVIDDQFASGRSELCFACCHRSKGMQQENILLSVYMDSDRSSAQDLLVCRLNCSAVIMCTTLMNDIKRIFSSFA